SQGRLEALINFQTVVADLTGLTLANCSLLDESTAAAEAATMMFALRSREQKKNKATTLFVDERIFPQTLAVLQTRAMPQGIQLEIGRYEEVELTTQHFGCIVQFPNAEGEVIDYSRFVATAHEKECKVAVIADLLSLTLLTPPGDWDADIAVGSTQRFGIPMYYGGPSAGYFATRNEFKRNIPGRIIGKSKDKYGHECFRLALQTREQHIKREKATSNICTAQALLATMAGFYAAYHGPEGLTQIAQRIHSVTCYLKETLRAYGYILRTHRFFDTLRIELPSTVDRKQLEAIALRERVNLYYGKDGLVGFSINESTMVEQINQLVSIFAEAIGKEAQKITELPYKDKLPAALRRDSTFLTHQVFNSYHTETEMMRYMKRLERKDISLAHSMIALGSCTMKLNAAAEVITLSMPQLMNLHPFAPIEQAKGTRRLIEELCHLLATITGFTGVTLQPNSGAAGEYTGLRMIRAYQERIGEAQRHIVLIPSSAHGTNPASAHQAGYDIVICKCDEGGNVDVTDLRNKAEQYKEELAALMITYPSTHGIFETEIREICNIIHQNGGQVYMDGANMNGQVGLTNPGTIGADVCHLNLHKTFAIPHGGGGPGVGAVGVAAHLVDQLPQHPFFGSTKNTVASAPFGSAGVLPVTYGYIRMLGEKGLRQCTETAILSANYLAASLQDTYGVVYRGANGYVGHEMILECRKLHEQTGISENDISKRLMDYGYHAPTLSFPVHGTLMIEPTESESLAELDNFITTMQTIYQEIEEVATGKADQADNVLINAPHPEYEAVADEWKHSYSRQKAVYPIESVRANKFWVNIARVDNTLGDRNLLATRYGSID
ncbi:MAG: aminomethyl-transferring glycine dehydrogenase, partial [Bacteroidaceae bacterium]|nr:aminomethyl-transferring glycine dehydrogenase [Bacteroidaceae bacterium]